ncbi:uncharacterized protein PG986_011580 [Apiospora aurea]|uniref:Uncharacterized protein n=1 Tax=Apiospora aurea TaxID=335848 RepID=A0ABR1PXJ2_9PEZI
MKSVAPLFFSLLAAALTTIAAPAPAPALEVHQAHDQDRPVITTPDTIVPLRLLDRAGNYTKTIEPRAVATGGEDRAQQQQFTFSSGDKDAPYMVCSRIPPRPCRVRGPGLVRQPPRRGGRPSRRRGLLRAQRYRLRARGGRGGPVGAVCGAGGG